MKRNDDGRNLTPMRALPLLRRLDAARHLVGDNHSLGYAIDAVTHALELHIQRGLAQKKRRKRK